MRGRMTLRPSLRWILLCLLAPVLAQAQLTSPGGVDGIGGLSDKAAGLGNFLGGGADITVTAKLALNDKDPTKGKLSVTAEMPGWHIYSLTQAPGGPLRTEISLQGDELELAGSFTPDSDPVEHTYEDVWPGLAVEEHEGKVTWSAEVAVKPEVNPQELSTKVLVRGQICNESGCQDVNESVAIEFTGSYKAPSTKFQGKLSKEVIWQGFVEPAVVKPGGKLQVHFRAEPTNGYFIYAYAPQPTEGHNETLIAMSKRMGWKGKISSNVEADPADEGPGHHEGPVIWTVTLDVPRDAEPGSYSMGGYIGFQTCNGGSCLPPDGAKFQFDIRVGDEADGRAALAFSSASYNEAKEMAARHPLSVPLKLADYAYIVAFGLLGGLILNLMPCVLPVIGLKVMSFAEQANKSRLESLKLNLWYSAGLLSVFLVLATMAAFLQMSWGQQFTYTWFKVAMTGLVFGMALSFLDVWEIPIPGFAGGNASQKLQQQEGAAGAFSKGVFTTLLATPCSGPFLGALFAYTLSQPPAVSYLIYGCIGLGMASPFLVAGAFPGLVKWLPAPGAWMDTFKQLMGFVLLGTVVFQFSTINPDYFIATLALMMGIWFALWLVGRLEFTAPRSEKAMRWATSIALIAISSWASFEYLTPHQKLLPWRAYSPAKLVKAQEEGKTVIVDFTAAWCLNCKLNLRYAIDTHDVLDIVEKYDVVPMLADWTDRSPEIKRSLAELNSNSIPVLAIYPADNPEQPIVLKDLLKEKQVIEAIRTAGPSKGASSQSDSTSVARAASSSKQQAE